MEPAAIPFAEIEALFLDAGNTLLHWDHAFVVAQARAAGFVLEPERVVRAEAAARPLLDRVLANGRSTEAPDTLRIYLECILAAGLGDGMETEEQQGLVSALSSALRGAKASDLLWSRVTPGLPASLARLREAGLRLVVVSNSDGSCARKLSDVGLGPLLHGVVDSAVVGVEKPDPAIFHFALRQSGCAPQRTLHVGDLYAIDVLGARRAGLHAALLDPYGDWRSVDCPRFPNVESLAAALLAARGA